MSKFIEHDMPVRRLGEGEAHHFFGYYNKSTWDLSGRLLLSNRIPMMTGDLTGNESADVGYFDLDRDDTFVKIGETTTWNWQMGCQLQWLANNGKTEIIYNIRAADAVRPYPDFASCIFDVETGESRTLPLPIYVVAPNGDYALCVNYSRFQATHRTIGYGATDSEPNLELAPADDGIWRMNLGSGDARLLVSLAHLRNHQPLPSMDRAIHWVTHLEVAPDSSRFLFIHRWTERPEDETCFLHRLYTTASDGSDIQLLECTDHPLPQLAANFDIDSVGTFDYEKSEYQISHPMWKDSSSVIVWGPHEGSIHYHLYDDSTDTVEIIGGDTLLENGHMTYSRDGRWILTDTYPDSETNIRLLLLYNVDRDECYSVGQFYTPPDLGKHNRCDLHPRFSRDDRFVTIDSVHEGSRQQYIIDVAGLLLT